MLGEAVADLLGSLLVSGGGSDRSWRPAWAAVRLRAGREARVPGALLTRRATAGTVRLRPGAAWWRPDRRSAAGEVLLCRDGVVEAVRPATRRESGAPGRVVVTLADDVRRSSVVVPEPFVRALRRALPG